MEFDVDWKVANRSFKPVHCQLCKQKNICDSLTDDLDEGLPGLVWTWFLLSCHSCVIGIRKCIWPKLARAPFTCGDVASL